MQIETDTKVWRADCIVPDATSVRVHIIGGPGSGKTHVSKTLAARFNVPVFELDEVAGAGAAPAFHMECPLANRLAEVARIAALPGWITEGSFLWWTDRLLEAADVIVWLDEPWHVASRRVIARHIREYVAEIRQSVNWREKLHAMRHPHIRHLISFLPYTGHYYLQRKQGDPTDQRDLDSGWAITRANTVRQLARFSDKIIHCTTRTQVSGLPERIQRYTAQQGEGSNTMRQSVPDSDGTRYVSKYAEMHKADWIPANYDKNIYRPDGYDTFVWDLYRPYLVQIVENIARTHKHLKYLDFACGTGRIIAALEDHATESVGLDISPQMAEYAQQKVSHSTIRCGDILGQQNIVDTDYDLITAFRFFLNTEPEMRNMVMKALASRLADRNSRLIFNVHANSWSVDALQSLYQRLRGWGAAHTLSYPEVRRLVDEAGLEIETWYGFGLWPHRLYRGRFGAMTRQVDQWAARIQPLRWISHDMLFVCRPRVK